MRNNQSMHKKNQYVIGYNTKDDGRVTLSGLLNFTDGLWSCCGEEKVIVFTTNYKDNVDPALVRCGHMDMHVSLGTCGMHAFKVLVKNYLGLDSHVLFDVAKSCIRSGGTLAPAHIGEILLRNRMDADVVVKSVLTDMQAKILGTDMHATEGGHEYDEMTRTPEIIGGRLMESLDNGPEGSLLKKKKEGSTWDKNVKFVVRLRSLTKSGSGRRGV